MKNRGTSPNARKWQRYNQWRSKSRAIDRARRLEKAQRVAADYVENYTVPKVPAPRLSAWATITIVMRDGRKSRLQIGETPFGLSISPTQAGKRVAEFLKVLEPVRAAVEDLHTPAGATTAKDRQRDGEQETDYPDGACVHGAARGRGVSLAGL